MGKKSGPGFYVNTEVKTNENKALCAVGGARSRAQPMARAKQVLCDQLTQEGKCTETQLIYMLLLFKRGHDVLKH